MKILVTGGAGYIGSHTVKQLGEAGGFDITVLDNLTTGFEDSILFGRLVRADLSDFAFVEKFLLDEKFDAIIHFAASIVVPESVENPLKYYMNNTVNTTNLVKCAVNAGVKYFIFSSTAAVYGEPIEGVVTEESQLSPINPYGFSKLMSEQVLKDTAAANSAFRFVILRYFNVAGASMDGQIGQRFPNATHLIKVASETACGKRKKMFIFGSDYDTQDCTCVRDYIHIDDLASAHLSALGYLQESGKSDIFNCGYGRGYSVKEVIESVKKVSGVDFVAEFVDRRAGDPSLLISNNQKILNTLNWKPKYDDIELICKSAYEWEKRL
ncbi:MAG TPA: UDP-glucose 4-epimerase GalE [Campylobacterales bacterium]|nr:UDP-glucose 4-epimerase GalE [Campylobacterales bacterium]